VKKQPSKLLELENQKIGAESFAKYDKDTLALIPLLYQAGYLTISSYDRESCLYTLSYPNGEVKSSFAKFLACYFGNSDSIDSDNYGAKLIESLKIGNAKEFIEDRNAKKIIKLGVKFSSKKKNVVDWGLC